MATKLFVGGISWDTTEDSLKTFFAQFGTVVSTTIIKDKFSGRSKGFGFVEMSSDEEAKTAVEKGNGQPLDGRNVAVSEARPMVPRDNNFSGGGGRGGYGGGDRGGQGRDDRRGGGRGRSDSRKSYR